MKALSRKGFRPVRQRGSHIMVENAEGKFAVVPRKDEIKRGTLLSILEQAGLTKDEFLELLGQNQSFGYGMAVLLEYGRKFQN